MLLRARSPFHSQKRESKRTRNLLELRLRFDALQAVACRSGEAGTFPNQSKAVKNERPQRTIVGRSRRRNGKRRVKQDDIVILLEPVTCPKGRVFPKRCVGQILELDSQGTSALVAFFDGEGECNGIVDVPLYKLDLKEARP